MLFVRTLWQFCKHLVGICVICEIKLDTHGADLLLVVFYINIYKYKYIEKDNFMDRKNFA